MLGAAPAGAADRIMLYYYERPPYSVTDPAGNAGGLVIAPTRMAFEAAGVPFQFERTSVNRILELIKDSPGPACSPGWYWTEERARYAKYTKPIFRDKPIIGLAAKGFHVAPGTRIADLLAGKTLLTVTENLSYGPYLDPLIARKDPSQLIHLPRGGKMMIEMVLSGHTELALTSEQDAQSYASLGIGGPDYPIIHFPDLAVGDTRHIICSRGVPDPVIDQLNQHIGTV
jgi:hypothetical protein